MAKSIFDKYMPPACEYCESSIKRDGKLYCAHTEKLIPAEPCRRFVYDPLRRVPRQEPRLPVFNEDSFKIG